MFLRAFIWIRLFLKSGSNSDESELIVRLRRSDKPDEFAAENMDFQTCSLLIKALRDFVKKIPLTSTFS